MKKIILSGSILVMTLALVAGATTSFYSDNETSSGNTLAAGAIDLGIDNESYYNGALNQGTTWELSYDLDDENGPQGPNGSYLFFNFEDLKPGDEGEDTISVHVKDNDAWACMAFDVTSDEDNGSTEPELDDEDPYTADDGELDDFINFVWWADDGDNVLEDDEAESSTFKQGSLSDIDDFDVILADASGNGIFQPDENSNPLEGDQTYYIGKAWCFGNLDLNPVDQDGLGKTGNNGPLDRGPGITCDGSGLDNSTQTDKITADVVFTAIQSRHNPDFKCNGGVGCLDKADVMLVLDRSRSISSFEMTSLKTAAKAFVDALAPSADGVHVGMVSFATTATLDEHLTAVGQDVKDAIDGLGVSGDGFTNLQHGIKLARIELENPGDGHDRPDGESPDVMVIVTDGAPNRCDDIGTSCSTAAAQAAAKTQADLAKADGNEIFAVGVGIEAANATFLKDDIVSSPSASHYFDAGDFDDLSAILADIASCEE